MRKLFTLLFAVLLTVHVFAQAPQTMSYQAVIRNTSGALVVSTPISIQISILQGSSTGSTSYVETQTSTTNANGLVSIAIGSGNVVSGTFSSIDWSAGPYFIKTETDPTGGTNYTIIGTSQLLSVPYALYAAKSGSAGIPYTGATAAVDLGTYDLKLNGLTVGKGSGAVSSNTVLGSNALQSNTTGSDNTAIGLIALQNNTIGNVNTAVGKTALRDNISGNDNVAVGQSALLSNIDGSENTAIGTNALKFFTTGNKNTAVGKNALLNNNSGSYNTALGEAADVVSGALSNTTAIGYNAKVEANNTIQLGNTQVTNVNTSGTITAPQIGIGTTSPNSSAALEINSTTGALLMPRMTTAQRDALTPVEGMILYNTTVSKFQGYTLGTAFDLPIVDQQQTSINNGGGEDRAQSFTAGISGNLSAIELPLASGRMGTSSVNIAIKAGDGVSGPILSTQTFTIPSGGTVWYTLNLSGVSVVAGSQYTIHVTLVDPAVNCGGICYDWGLTDGDTYSGGQYYYGGSPDGGGFDCAFKTYVQAEVPKVLTWVNLH